VQHRQPDVADGATMPAGIVRAAVEVAGPVPEAHGGVLGHGGELDGFGDAAGPDETAAASRALSPGLTASVNAN